MQQQRMAQQAAHHQAAVMHPNSYQNQGQQWTGHATGSGQKLESVLRERNDLRVNTRSSSKRYRYQNQDEQGKDQYLPDLASDPQANSTEGMSKKEAQGKPQGLPTPFLINMQKSC
eukprot:15178830-Heterocapsa_arctica.AAC.1